jgi:hypothetical protein
MKDCVNRHQPAHRYKEDRREWMSRNSVYRCWFTPAKDEDTARRQSKENNVD